MWRPSPLPTVAPSTNHASNASDSAEGEAGTPNSQFSMVMRAVDGWKRQIIPEPALSHWLPPPPTVTFLVQLTNCHVDPCLSSLFRCIRGKAASEWPRPGRWRGSKGYRGPPAGSGLGPAWLSVALGLGSMYPG